MILDSLADPTEYVEWGGAEAVPDPRPGGPTRAGIRPVPDA